MEVEPCKRCGHVHGEYDARFTFPRVLESGNKGLGVKAELCNSCTHELKQFMKGAEIVAPKRQPPPKPNGITSEGNDGDV